MAVSVEATDASGDAVWYIYRAHRLEGGVATLPPDSLGFPLAYGPTTSPNVRVELPGGDVVDHVPRWWTIFSLTVPPVHLRMANGRMS